jgi:hypothetical protein
MILYLISERSLSIHYLHDKLRKKGERVEALNDAFVGRELGLFFLSYDTRDED